MQDKPNFHLNMQMILPSHTQESLPMDLEDDTAEEINKKPFVEADPPEIEYGTVYLGQVCQQKVKIRSSCLADVSISSSLFSIVYFNQGR